MSGYNHGHFAIYSSEVTYSGSHVCMLEYFVKLSTKSCLCMFFTIFICVFGGSLIKLRLRLLDNNAIVMFIHRFCSLVKLFKYSSHWMLVDAIHHSHAFRPAQVYVLSDALLHMYLEVVSVQDKHSMV